MHTLRETIANVRMEERRRLAGEIHDRLGQLLSAAKIDLRLLERRTADRRQALDRAATLGEVRSALSSIEQAIASVQDISLLLRPPALESGGLPAALRWHAAEFQRRFQLNCTVSHAEAGYVEPPRFVAGELLRICQEALTNVLRHADASAVLVQLTVRGHHLVVRVCDNGTGIARGAVARPDAIGIAGMRERAAGIGASLHIHGRPARGTMVTLRWPPGSWPAMRESSANGRVPAQQGNAGQA
jgi:signal transduction histidine kinase